MKKIAIIMGEKRSGVQNTAIAELTRIILDYTLEYPICKQDGEGGLEQFKCIYIGTKDNNSYIKKHSKAALTKSEEYYISAKRDAVIIEGYDDGGVLYGVIDFYNKYIIKHEYMDDDAFWRNFILDESFPEYEHQAHPAVGERGLWTWSHVIYDYRGYFDNMMRLKMNKVIIWCDYLPVNASEMVEYAHARNIKVIWGYSWLWDTDCKKFDLKNLDSFPKEIFEKYEREYARAGGDGIYFQTFTELREDSINGVYIADAATDLVNRTVKLFFEKYPQMEIQFGLHATSVKSRLASIAQVDPRVKIVWEDCGAFPFSYVPSDISRFEETKNLALRVARLRGDEDNFGVVTKGLVKLDWQKFEHPKGAHYMTSASRELRENRLIRKRNIWRYVQAHWLANADKAEEMADALCKVKDGNLSIFALVEDGMFEEEIFFPVALYSEILWNTGADLKSLITDVALRRYITFA